MAPWPRRGCRAISSRSPRPPSGFSAGAVSPRRAGLVALALCAATGAGCGVVGSSVELSDAQQVIADMKLGPSELRVVGGVDHADRSYRVGEPIALSLQVNQDANAAVLRVLPNGATTLIFPNK